MLAASNLSPIFSLTNKFSEIIGYPGAPKAPLTKEFGFSKGLDKPIPIFQILDKDGKISNPEMMEQVEKVLDKKRMLKMYHSMIKIRIIDDLFVIAQRQGRITSYMKNTGEEAIQIGVAEAMDKDDVAHMQYREHGLVMHRGFTVDEMLNQCLATTEDYLKGRRMPIHYGSKKVNCIPVSPPLCTQVPQAAGQGYTMRMDGRPNVTVCFFGDGSASEGDVHSGMNFAAVRRSNTIFLCRNNGYAISTPVKDQYRGDGIASRAIGYGIPFIRIDGFDIFSTFYTTYRARQQILGKDETGEAHGPIFIETMGYRLCNHTTSDDSLKYRSQSEIDSWANHHDPVNRFRKYLIEKGHWSKEEDKDFERQTKKEIADALHRGEVKPRVAPERICEDVYAEVTPRLKRQFKFSMATRAKYEAEYFEK